MPTPSRVVKLLIVNDFVCPFCYIGQHELLDAISYCRDVLQLPLSFDLEYRPFRLIGCLKEDTTNVDKATFYTNKLGKERYEASQATVEKWAKEKGVPISFRGPMSQTIRAHRLSQKALIQGGQALQLPVLSALFKAYLEDEKDIGDLDVLADIAEQTGVMTKDEAITFLKSDELHEEVLQLTDEARSKGVTGVPLTVIDGKWAVKGGQPSETFVQIFKRLADPTAGHPTASPILSAVTAAVC
ncbi:hypothetical protein HGRIS_003557 [Hohenbuehelia grisea]|uniref:DSBA-like thioredoxin domain-containing protein n=1 Tax=Hohenbuehelia grisea TaxID=104357 RepID=A0ABR3JFY3_9AGAR